MALYKGMLYWPLFFLNTVFFVFLAHKISKKTVIQLLILFLSVGPSVFIGTHFEQYLVEQKLAAFDINHDELFSANEIIEEQERWLGILTHDTYRLFLYLISFPYAFLVSILGVLLPRLIKPLLRKRNNRFSGSRSNGLVQ
jgi:hypothetical protein